MFENMSALQVQSLLLYAVAGLLVVLVVIAVAVYRRLGDVLKALRTNEARTPPPPPSLVAPPRTPDDQTYPPPPPSRSATRRR